MDGQAITTKSDLERILLDQSMEAKAKRLSLSLLECITNSFSDEHEIGRGGFAVVYKGLLEYGEVAVKKLTQNCIDEEKFIGEVHCLMMMKAKHKNIVRFLGYCSDTQGEMVEHNGKLKMAEVRQRLLCFEYIANGSLAEYIKDASREWGMCYKIIKGVCEGLHHLHKERIVHRDLKPANILLENDMVPKITDFGISRCFGELQTHVVTSKLVGTLGYLAPELHHGKISFKSDIYSLGIIIIEILTGDKVCPEVEKVQEDWSHKLEGSQKELQLEQIRVCMEVAQSCLEFNPEKRPYTQTIVDILEHAEIEEQCIESGARSHNPGGGTHQTPKSGARSHNPGGGAHQTPKRWLTIEIFMQAIEKAEIEKQCIESGARSHNPGGGAHQTLKPWPGTVEIVKQAIYKIYARDVKDLSFLHLHSDVCYSVHLGEGEVLYSAAETTMASEVQRLCRPLDDAAASADSALFLQELLTKWDLHIWALQKICVVFMYMDHMYIPDSRKMPTYDLGLHLWRDEMIRSDKIRQSLIEAVKRQKGGEDELVPGVNKMLTELGAHVKDKDNMAVLYFHDGTEVEDGIVTYGNDDASVNDDDGTEVEDGIVTYDDANASVNDAGPQRKKRAKTSGPEWVS